MFQTLEVQQFKVKIPGRGEVLKDLKSVAVVKTGQWVEEKNLQEILNILIEKVGVKNVLQQVCMCQILKKAFIELSKV